MTMLDLLLKPELVDQAWDYFRNVQTKDIKYQPLIRPDDKPAIWLNKEIMDKYRPELKKFYYDPTKYKTYLEQLGIKYPTVKASSSELQNEPARRAQGGARCPGLDTSQRGRACGVHADRYRFAWATPIGKSTIRTG